MRGLAPGATIGVLGGGQLARMFTVEALRLGYRVVVLDADPRCSASQVGAACVAGQLDDASAAKTLAAQCDVITLDTEHVPASLLEKLEELVPVLPCARVLSLVQDRLAQRRFIANQEVPQVLFAEVSDRTTLHAAAAKVGLPCILKTRRSGYDGKGQRRVDNAADLDQAWSELGSAPATAEAFVDFEREVSALLVRDQDGNVRFYPPAENEHRQHVLYKTRVPARLSPVIVEQVNAIGGQLAHALNHVGMMAVEFFVTREGTVLVNEIAPRTHNSGHYTLGGCVTSQFEQHLRAICGLPLGDTRLRQPAVMLNLLGDLWNNGAPDFHQVLASTDAHLHLYGKSPPLPGRKMGHILVLSANAEDADADAERMIQRLNETASAANANH